MFFNAKKLIAQKEQLNDKIRAEHHTMDVAYLNLKNAIRVFTAAINILTSSI